MSRVMPGSGLGSIRCPSQSRVNPRSVLVRPSLESVEGQSGVSPDQTRARLGQIQVQSGVRPRSVSGQSRLGVSKVNPESVW
eukprot:6089943-Pyramimonas_sp.AAC.1